MSIKDVARVDDDGHAKWGQQLPRDGFHLLKIEEGIQVTERSSDNVSSILIPFIVDGDKDEDNGLRFPIFRNITDEDYRKGTNIAVSRILVAAGVASEFDEKLGDVDDLFATKERTAQVVLGMQKLLTGKVIEAITKQKPWTSKDKTKSGVNMLLMETAPRGFGLKDVADGKAGF